MMLITEADNDKLRIQLVMSDKVRGAEMLADFEIPDEWYTEFKSHVIETLLDFRTKKREGIKFLHIESLKRRKLYPDSELPDNHPEKFEWDLSKVLEALKENKRVVIK